MYKFCFYVPESHLETVKQAVFKAGAGRIGCYDACCWQVKGEGQFRPLTGSQSCLGQIDEVTVVSEYKVEMVCETHLMAGVLKTFRDTHPYETPAFDILPMLDPDVIAENTEP